MGARPGIRGTALEVVAVTDRSAVMTWTTVDPSPRGPTGAAIPVASPGRVLIAEYDDPTSWRIAAEHGPTAFHHAEVDGLEPGRRYRWRAESGGRVPRSSAPDSAPPVLRTLDRPPGRELGRIAVLSDLHLGERVAGSALGVSWLPGGGFPPGLRVDPDAPYWRHAAAAAVADAHGRGCDLLVAAGDLSDAGAVHDLAEARAVLDGFGALAGTGREKPDEPRVAVLRGNHDGAARAGGDALRDVFAGGFADGATHWSHTVGDRAERVRVVGLDSVGPRRLGALDDGELGYLEAELGRGDATVVVLHHPPGDRTGLPSVPPGALTVARGDAARFRDVVARHDNVAAVVSGHTHRARVRLASGCGGVPFVEVPSVKEYPSGWTELRVFSGGLLGSFRTVADPLARAWAERTRRAAFGRWAHYARGRLGDRSWSVDYGLQGVRVRRAGPAAALVS